MNQVASVAALTKGDLIPDHALTELEPDAFKHTEIAERVADLLTTADPPLNVALFGPWGSGKSSFATLLKKALTERRMKTKFVVYNAWKYSGEALQRSFISETAKELGVEDELFTHQLAQTVERTQLDLKQVTSKQARAYLKWVCRLVLPLVVFGLSAIAATITILSLIADRSVSRELLRHFGLLGGTLVVGLITAAFKLIADSTKARVQEGPLTEERFEKRFQDLLAEAKGDHERFIFFIDELDRVSPRQVVEALSTIKNFLDQDNVVFVVAADKDVLEQAFKKLPQATPANEDEPYYSSASEFLDKIFQHQLALPPLRGPSLLRFAHDLVITRAGGVWEELRNAKPDGLLDRVLYVLIPSHVRSPRRVKVLLNNFATNARIAQSRGVDWVTRARDIAKLTVFQTEFPLLAADLPDEPRLPALLLDCSGRVLSGKTHRLLERHSLEVTNDANHVQKSDGQDADGSPPIPNTSNVPAGNAVDDSMAANMAGATDRLLAPSTDHAKLVGVQRDNLRRYLIRTNEVRNPSRELLFLEPGGSAEGLTDPELGELLEAEAVDNPGAVVAAANERTKDEQQTIAVILAGMSEQAWSEERSNIITALLDVVRVLEGDLGRNTQTVADAVASFARSAPLEERHLAGALRVGLAAARATGDTTLRDQVLADDRLLESTARVEDIAPLIDDLPANAAEKVREAIAAKLPETTSVLTEPLSVVSPEAADALFCHGGIQDAIQTIVTESDADEIETITGDLFEILDDREVRAPIARLRLMQVLAESETPNVYPTVRSEAEKMTIAKGESQIATRVVLTVLPLGPPQDWQLWTTWIDEEIEGIPGQKEKAQNALAKLFGSMSNADQDELETALELAPKIVSVGGLSGEDDLGSLRSTVQSALEARAWWSDPDLFDKQERIHTIVRTVGSALGSASIPEFAAFRYADIVRAVDAGFTAIAFRAVTQWTVEMEVSQIRDLATRLSNASLSGDHDRDVELVAARTHLRIDARDVEENVDETPYAIGIDMIVATARPGDTRAQGVVVSWMDGGVTEEAVLEMIAGIERPPAPTEADALRAWFLNLNTKDDRTDFLLKLAGVGGYALAWLSEVASTSPRDYSEEVVAHSVVSDAMKASRAEERREAVDALVALGPDSKQAQREVGRLIVWLLSSGQKVNYEIALDAVRALGADHGNGRKIGEAFRKECEREKKKIPYRDQEAFRAAKIVLAQGYFEKPKKKGPLSRLLGR